MKATRRALLVLVPALVLMAGTTGCSSASVPDASVTTTTVTTTTSPVTTTTPPGAVPLVPPTSRWLWPLNLFSDGNVQEWPVLSASATYAAAVVSDYTHDYGTVGVNFFPIYEVPSDQPTVPVSVSPGCSDFLGSTGANIPVPSYATLTGTSDSPLVIYQPSTETDWELWQATRNANGTYSACWGGELDMATSDGVFGHFYGLSATGISYLATTVTEADVASGSIDHALALLLPQCNSWTYPADRGDCHSEPGQPSEGQWFRFPANTPMPRGLTPFAKMVFAALKNYGAVVTDFSAAVVIVAEQTSDWSAEGHRGVDPITASMAGQPIYKLITSLPWSKLQAVDPPGAP